MQLLFLLAALPTCSCPLEEPSNRVCKIVSDDIDLTEYDDRLSMLDQVEVLMGTLSLKGRNATGFPKLKNLVLLKEPKKRPVLVIEKNSKLSSLEALYNLEIQLRKDKNASTVPFVIKYLSRVPICEGKDDTNEAGNCTSAVIIIFIVITNV
ncbi:hypothetical protein V3C99_008698 [Haemonchus contortus]